MSISWLSNNNSLFSSFDIRDNFITNLKKYTSIPIDKACFAAGIDYPKFYKVYLDEAHPDPLLVSGACTENQFKNLLQLYGIKITYTVQVAYNLKENEIQEINGFIGERIKKNRVTRG